MDGMTNNSRAKLDSRDQRATLVPKRRLRASSRSGGFTLVEILIVVVILGILAMIVIPKFSNASHQARENTLKDDLRYLRTQIQVYKAQHRDIAPGYGGTATFVEQMTMFTDDQGNTNPTYTKVFRFGPYLTKMPTNPLNEKETLDVAGPAETTLSKVDGGAGWVYKPTTGEIIADLTGNDSNGTAYASY